MARLTSDERKIIRGLIKAGPSSCIVLRRRKTPALFAAGEHLVAEGLLRITQSYYPGHLMLMLTDAGACSLALTGAR